MSGQSPPASSGAPRYAEGECRQHLSAPCHEEARHHVSVRPARSQAPGEEYEGDQQDQSRAASIFTACHAAVTLCTRKIWPPPCMPAASSPIVPASRAAGSPSSSLSLLSLISGSCPAPARPGLGDDLQRPGADVEVVLGEGDLDPLALEVALGRQAEHVEHLDDRLDRR